MAKKLGNDYLVWIESATAGTFTLVKGQQSVSISREAASIDTTTKDDLGYGTSAPGLKSLSISLDAIPNLTVPRFWWRSRSCMRIARSRRQTPEAANDRRRQRT